MGSTGCFFFGRQSAAPGFEREHGCTKHLFQVDLRASQLEARTLSHRNAPGGSVPVRGSGSIVHHAKRSPRRRVAYATSWRAVRRLEIPPCPRPAIQKDWLTPLRPTPMNRQRGPAGPPLGSNAPATKDGPVSLRLDRRTATLVTPHTHTGSAAPAGRPIESIEVRASGVSGPGGWPTAARRGQTRSTPRAASRRSVFSAPFKTLAVSLASVRRRARPAGPLQSWQRRAVARHYAFVLHGVSPAVRCRVGGTQRRRRWLRVKRRFSPLITHDSWFLLAVRCRVARTARPPRGRRSYDARRRTGRARCRRRRSGNSETGA